MIPDIKHIFFDLDHTLWDFDRNSKLAFKRLFLKHKIELNLEDFLLVYEPINLYYWKLYREERITKEEMRRERFSTTFKEFGVNYENAFLDEMANTYIDELPKNNYLFEGVNQLLNYLAPKYHLHIITNGFEEVQHIKLKNSRIAPFFKTVTTSEEAGVKKPNPIIFQKALEKATAHAKQSLMIGDTFEADILGAEAVGMETLFFNYRNDVFSEKHKTIHHIKEVKKYV